MAVTVPVTEKALIDQLKRLRGYPRFEDFKSELLRVMKRRTESAEHAERVIDHVIDTRRPSEDGFVSCPTPAELGDACASISAHPERVKRPDATCPKCGGSGWRMEEHELKQGVFAGEMREVAIECECRKVGA